MWRAKGEKATEQRKDLFKADITGLEWVRSFKGSSVSGGNFMLRVRDRLGNYDEFAGFKEADFELLSEFASTHFGRKLQPVRTVMRGANWGKADVKGNMLIFRSVFDQESADNDGETLRVNLADVVGSKLNKNEVLIEFSREQTLESEKEDESLVELRFYCPTKAAIAAATASTSSTTANGSSTENPDKEDKEEEEEDVALALYNSLQERKSTTGETDIRPLAIFENVALLTPRGRYNVEVMATGIRLRGKTYDFKISNQQIFNMFLLPKPGETQEFFVIQLESPIRQGQTTYMHIVFGFAKDEEFTKEAPLKLNMTEEEIQTRFPDKGIHSEMVGPFYEVVAKLIRGTTQKKIVGPGSFTASNNQKGVKCALGPSEGYLFLLEKSIYFLHKPPTYLLHDEIKIVKFQRASSQQQRYFDVSMILKKGKTPTFSSIMKKEYDLMLDFLRKKNLRIEADKSEDISSKVAATLGEEDEDESDEEDEDFNMNESESEDSDMEVDLVPEDGPVKAKKDDEANERSPKKKKDADDDDESEEEKEKPPKKKKKKDTEEEEEEKEKPKKKKKAADAKEKEEKPKKKKKDAKEKEEKEEQPKKKKKRASKE